MRIQYHNPIHHLNILLNQVLEEKMIKPGLEATILVTKDEMVQLVRHADSRKAFPEYFAELDEKRRKLESKTAKLHQNKEKLTTLEERERVFNQISENEQAMAKLDTIPTTLISRGVAINVSMRG